MKRIFLPKKGFVIKTKCLYILILGGGGGGGGSGRGGGKNVGIVTNFSVEHVTSSNPCSFQFLKIHLNTTCNNASAEVFLVP